MIWSVCRICVLLLWEEKFHSVIYRGSGGATLGAPEQMTWLEDPPLWLWPCWKTKEGRQLCWGNNCIQWLGFRILTALHWMQSGLFARKVGLTLSVRPSVKRLDREKTEDFYIRPFSLAFWENAWLVGATPCRWNFGSNWPHWSEIAVFQSIFAGNASAVTSSRKKFY